MKFKALLTGERKKEEERYRRYFEKYYGVGLVFAALFFWSWRSLKIYPELFLSGIPHFIKLVGEMIPPNWQVLTGGNVAMAVLETLSMAFVGTVFGAILSFFLGIFAAQNVTPAAPVRELCRYIMALERAVPTLIIILLLVVFIGLGPFAGMVAIAIGSVGMLGKLFAEAIEHVDPRPLESLEAAGATRLQLIRYAVLPQVIPSFIANSLYRFDINLRTALFLGIVGGGGIGLNLHVAMSLFRYADALAITVIVLLLIVTAEKFSDYLRKKIIGQEVLS